MPGAVEQQAAVPYTEKERLFREVKSDPRYEHYLYGCFECGICVASCPSARFYDFSPRRIAQTMSREDVETFYEILTEDVWNCSQCFSCNRCPRGNSPGGIVTIMREVAVRHGLESAQEALEGYGRVIYKIISMGTQVSPDMLQADAFPDWGPGVRAVAENLEAWRRAIPPDTLHTTNTAWRIDEKTITELYLIWHLTGVLEMIREVDESLHDILGEIMEDTLAERGYVL